jgi:hypothetical protein
MCLRIDRRAANAFTATEPKPGEDRLGAVLNGWPHRIICEFPKKNKKKRICDCASSDVATCVSLRKKK